MHCAQLTVYLGSGCSYGAALDRHGTELGQRPPFFTEAQRLEGSDLPTPSPCRGLPVSFLASLGKPLPQKGASPRHNILCVSVCMFMCVACVCAYMCICVCVCVHSCGGQRAAVGCPSGAACCILKRQSFMNLELTE